MARTAPGPLQRVCDGLELLRWNHPSGRLILLIPAGWALWLNPASPPSLPLLALMVLGGLAVSGAGCVANDLWDRRIDPLVERTRNRPLADGRIGVPTAVVLLIACLVVALLVVLALPPQGRVLALPLALAALPPRTALPLGQALVWPAPAGAGVLLGLCGVDSLGHRQWRPAWSGPGPHLVRHRLLDLRLRHGLCHE